MNTAVYQIMREIQKLPKETRLRLVSCIVESVLESDKNDTVNAEDFKCPNLEGDVKVAQWHLKGQVADTK